MKDFRHDSLLQGVAAIRPSLDPEAESSSGPQARAVLSRVATSPRPRRTLKPRIVVPVGVATIAVGIAGAMLLTEVAPVQSHKVGARNLPPAGIELVLDRSQEAMRSGRAVVTYVGDIGSDFQMRVNGAIEFAGNDVAMRLDFEGSHGRPGFTTRNMTVDGEFYLWDGVPGHKYWVHDVGANAGSTDPFSVDPRNLLEALDPSARFETIDEEDGVRHLRATSLDDIPEMNLGMGPAADAEVTSLELWVGSDDVVKQLDFTYDITEHYATGDMYVKDENGNRKRFVPPAGMPKSRTLSSSYSVRFFDIGMAIEIAPPADAVEVQGQG